MKTIIKLLISFLKLSFGFLCYLFSPVIILGVIAIGIVKIIVGNNHLIEPKNYKK